MADSCGSGPYLDLEATSASTEIGATQGSGRAEELGSGVIVLIVVKGFNAANKRGSAG